MQWEHYSPQSETPWATVSHVHPHQKNSLNSSPQIALTPELQSSSPFADSRHSTPASFNPDVEMGSSPRSRGVDIEDITGQEDEYDNVYVPEDPRMFPGARSE